MTLIECFDRTPLDNIAACLQIKPDKLIFLGDKEQMHEPAQRYVDFFARRRLHTKVYLQDVRMNDMEQIANALEQIVRRESDCVIDITGGEEPVLLAVGAVLAGLDEAKRQHITVRKFDVYRGLVEDFDGDTPEVADRSISLSVEELIRLHGGEVHPRSEQPPHTLTLERIKPLWDMVRQNPRQWNTAISYLHEFESRCDSKTDIELSLDDLSNITDFAKKETLVRELLDKLDKIGVIRDRSNFRTLRYKYTDPLLHKCVKKEGNLLEFKTLLQARALQERGKPYFSDCQMSVTLDWDGDIRESVTFKPQTRNEIDVLLTRGMNSLFISCKNGHIDDEELFKLQAVARHFGSHYARVMLIATELDQKSSKADESFIKRAKDMGICLVPYAARLSDSDWDTKLKDAMEGK